MRNVTHILIFEKVKVTLFFVCKILIKYRYFKIKYYTTVLIESAVHQCKSGYDTVWVTSQNFVEYHLFGTRIEPGWELPFPQSDFWLPNRPKSQIPLRLWNHPAASHQICWDPVILARILEPFAQYGWRHDVPQTCLYSVNNSMRDGCWPLPRCRKCFVVVNTACNIDEKLLPHTKSPKR